ncbi:hypothetical protein J2Z35_001132 [Acetoanaerobium pronyense]|uniref:Hydrolase n=1 Tax=Acetoanaerobium pronyense TaxID=1482736 RepID=A0ABS4KHX6_9FIRM|nr:hydrolase [Acetoanaerobium pronyense]MBP2027338.1 hypothetical protein [Acetoanaerobium pronyense]
MENPIKDKKFIPVIESKLRKRIVEVPKEIYEASGINIFGKRIKSLIFSTDVAIIKNSNADGVIAVYPFTPQLSITHAIIDVSPSPVFAGVGGGITTGQRSIDIALHAELNGAFGIVLNAPTPNALIMEMKKRIDIPIVITVVSEKENIEGRIKAGVSIFNVSGGAKTAQIVRNIRERFPEVPIIATGGPTVDSIRDTIKAGANAITYTPPTSGELFSDIMDNYRETL